MQVCHKLAGVITAQLQHLAKRLVLAMQRCWSFSDVLPEHDEVHTRGLSRSADACRSQAALERLPEALPGLSGSEADSAAGSDMSVSALSSAVASGVASGGDALPRPLEASEAGCCVASQALLVHSLLSGRVASCRHGLGVSLGSVIGETAAELAITCPRACS